MTRRGGLRLVELEDRARGDYADSGGAEPLHPVSPLRITSRSVVVNWRCACGQGYRVRTEPLTFWPHTSPRAIRSEHAKTCVDCGADLEEQFALDAARLVSAAMLA